MSDDLLLSLIESRVASFANRNQQSLPKSTFIPVRWMRTRWSSDPDACGVYSYYPRGGSGEGKNVELLPRNQVIHSYQLRDVTYMCIKYISAMCHHPLVLVLVLVFLLSIWNHGLTLLIY